MTAVIDVITHPPIGSVSLARREGDDTAHIAGIGESIAIREISARPAMTSAKFSSQRGRLAPMPLRFHDNGTGTARAAA